MNSDSVKRTTCGQRKFKHYYGKKTVGSAPVEESSTVTSATCMATGIAGGKARM